MTKKRRPTKFQLGRGNMFPDGGDMDDWAAYDPRFDNDKDRERFQEIVDNLNPVPNFIQRLRVDNPDDIAYIQNPDGTRSSHVLNWSTNQVGHGIAYPDIQEVNGELVDFRPITEQPGHEWDSYDSAIDNDDYIEFENPEDADIFTSNYKKLFPVFMKAFDKREKEYGPWFHTLPRDWPSRSMFRSFR